jgi:O-succinylhomoserine sulfhydrylase
MMKGPKMRTERPDSLQTRLVHGGARRSQFGEMAEAIYLTQGFVYETAEAAEARFVAAGEDEFIYARYGNPTVRIFEDRIAGIEGTEDAFATASGMAAVNGALMALLKSGDHVVAARALFGSCLYLLEMLAGRFGVEVSFVDGTDLGAWRAAIRPGTRAVFFETISNPTLEVVDIAAVAEMAHAVGALVIVDHVFATPVFGSAAALGADLVVYSATKHIDGQGRALGGVICGSRALIRGPVETYMKHSGAAMSPFTAWIMLNGMVTLDLRCRAMAASAARIAAALEGHGQIVRLIYPGLPTHPQHALVARQMQTGGTMLAFEVAGGKPAAFAVLNRLRIASISNNLGDARTIATHPATTTHQRLSAEARAQLGISDGLIRLSVGLEDTEDLIADMTAALG